MHSSSRPTPQPGSRPISPSSTQVCYLKISSRIMLAKTLSQAGSKRARNLPLGSGSGSDVDTAAGSGAEMSESGKTKKLKLNPRNNASRSGTPSGSRAASPVAGNRSFSGSRASSPDGARGKSFLSLPSGPSSTLIEFPGPGRTSTPNPSGKGGYPTHAEVHAAIPATGIGSSQILRIFRHRLGENHKRFIDIVKEVSIYGPDKLLRPAPWREEWN